MSTASYNPRGMPGMREIMELARLLRQNGDKVLSATSKLTLSTSLLNDLNEAFTLIVDQNEDLESSFQVCNSSKTDIFRDLKFLHDFVQKTISLKITHRSNESRTNIDITKFRHLRYLELQKVCIESLRGLQGIRGQLESVVCAGGRGVGSVGRLLAACGGDAGIGFVWGSLRSLALPYNALVRIDKSLELAPWLQTLDLSHNLISTAAEIDLNCLPNLKNINFGYNKLEAVPVFNKPVFHTLQVLVLRNNYIENLSGLRGLESLSELDLSFNCLTEHSDLWPLEGLSALLWVSLEGNPLSYHPRHRLLSVKHLHPNVADSKFVLDHTPLSKTEKQVVSENRSFPIRSMRSASGDGLSSLTSSTRSDVTIASIETSALSDSMIQSRGLDSLEGLRPSKSRKKRNVKEAVIADDDHEKPETLMSSSVTSSIEMSMDHLEIKERIAALREKFGKNDWLHSHAGTFVQDIMGLERSTGVMLSSTPAVTTPSNTPVTTSIYDSSSINLDSYSSPSEPSLDLSEGDKFTKIESDNKESKNRDDDKNEDSSYNTDSAPEELSVAAPIRAESPYDPDQENGDVYLVQRNKIGDESEQLFLIVTPEYIKERDPITQKLKCRWATNTVLSCVMGRGEATTVDIIFDTSRRDRQNRTYFMELDEAKQLVATVSETMNAQPITLKVFKCMKCSTHFSEDVEHTTFTSVFPSDLKGPKCPTCKSTLVIQDDELPTPKTDKAPPFKGKEFSELPQEQSSEVLSDMGLHRSGSHSSIGAMESDTNTVPSSMVYSDLHPQAQAQVQCSATSLDDSRESTPSAGTVTKRYESDIEVLSNPSQSSIEVLDEHSKWSLSPGRTRSSEERRLPVDPSLPIIPDVNAHPHGLTESSSSGSLTDGSVCTTYENKVMKNIEGNKWISKLFNGMESQKLIEEREQTPQPTNNLSSMLGGLLLSMKIGPSKSSPTSETDAAFVGSVIQYSYTDFSSIDHRVKLHIGLNIIEHEKEELVLLLRAEILAKDMVKTFPGCLVLSTSKVYLLKITGPEGEDPQKWLQKECSWTMDRLRTVAPLPFKQGILVDFCQPAKAGEVPSNTTILCILQDFQRTTNFLSYLTDLPLPGSCEVEFSVPAHCNSRLQDLLQSSIHHQAGDAVRLLALFSSCTVKNNIQTMIIKVAGLLVTVSALLVIDENMQWLIEGSSERPAIKTEEAMSNLIEVEHNGSSLKLNFSDDGTDTDETWVLDFVSSGAAETVINSIQPPWEELFSVPLQVTTIDTGSTPKT